MSKIAFEKAGAVKMVDPEDAAQIARIEADGWVKSDVSAPAKKAVRPKKDQ